MTTRTIPRAAVDSSLRILRWPIDTAVGLLPGADEGARPAAQLTVDRADANLRDLAGRVLADDELRQDAARRRVAADERERALHLRFEARRKQHEADDRLAERQESADERREAAERRAAHEREAAERRRKERARRAADTERKRREASQTAKAKVEQDVAERAKRERLEQLERRDDALEERSEALTARDEAQRLRDAAGRAKAARKAD